MSPSPNPSDASVSFAMPSPSSVGYRPDDQLLGRAEVASLVADDGRGLDRAAGADAQGAQPDSAGRGNAWDRPHLRLFFGRERAALQAAPPVGAVDEHGCGLALDRAGEGCQQPVAQRLLEQDQKDEQGDRTDQKAETQLRPCHLLPRDHDGPPVPTPAKTVTG